MIEYLQLPAAPITSQEDEIIKALHKALQNFKDRSRAIKNFLDKSKPLEDWLDRLAAVLNYAILIHDKDLLKALINSDVPLRCFVDAHILEPRRISQFVNSLKDGAIKDRILSEAYVRMGLCSILIRRSDADDSSRCEYSERGIPLRPPISLIYHLVTGNFPKYEALSKKIKDKYGSRIVEVGPEVEKHLLLYAYVFKGLDRIYRTMAEDNRKGRQTTFSNIYNGDANTYPYLYFLLYLYADPVGKLKSDIEKKAERILDDYVSMYRGRFRQPLTWWKGRYVKIHGLWSRTSFNIVPEIFKYSNLSSGAEEIFLFWTFYLLRTDLSSKDSECKEHPFWLNFNYDGEVALMYRNRPCSTAEGTKIKSVRCNSECIPHGNLLKPRGLRTLSYLVLSFYSKDFDYRRGPDPILFSEEWSFIDRWDEWTYVVRDNGRFAPILKDIANNLEAAESTVKDIVYRSLGGDGTFAKLLMVRNNLVPNALLCSIPCEDRSWKGPMCEWMKRLRKQYHTYLIGLLNDEGH